MFNSDSAGHEPHRLETPETKNDDIETEPRLHMELDSVCINQRYLIACLHADTRTCHDVFRINQTQITCRKSRRDSR